MKKQKTPAENFSFEASEMALSVEPEKFVRPGLSRTGIRPSYAEMHKLHKSLINK
ncbi:hypothetical protein BCL90_3268 [Pedobacter alluvionis]|uniref:Uncharacterized protein n=1 Tax=Pedobacter alluvionis TaxID=475253 RepID=A0A497XY89_9SPHI|nr:hypothetical protein BCL90_3268 [Pedobacter alluvionis]